MLFTDIRECKSVLEVDQRDSSEDKKLNFFIEQASQWIEEFLGRPGLEYKARTEFYKGSGTQKLQLRARPVYTTPTISLSLDEAGYYGEAKNSFAAADALVYGDDFALQVDQANGTSRSGILLRINSLWPKPTLRQMGYLSPFIGEGFGTIKITYTAGYKVEDLPASLRFACNMIVAKMRYLFPLGMELSSESYEERAISMISHRDYLFGQVKPLLYPFRNWKFS